MEEIVFIGDSITEGWCGKGRAIWAKHYDSRNAYNYGMEGERIEHLLIRIDNREFDGLNPKVTVLMIGKI